MIYVLEGPDGVGKTTLANAIAEKVKGHILHCTWNAEWNMKDYFTEVLYAAMTLNRFQDVVIDRWAPSEFVYGNVFRGGPQFDIFDFLWEHEDSLQHTKWIICKNENAIENHLKNRELRVEMFEDMSEIVKEFDTFVNATKNLNWIEYDYDKVDMKEFVANL